MGKKKHQQRGGGSTKPPLVVSSTTNNTNNGSSNGSSSSSSIGSFLAVLFGLPFCILKLAVWSVVGIPVWLLVLVLLPFFGRPPTLQTWSQSWRFLTTYTWFPSSSSSSLPTSRKIFLTLAILEHTIKSSVFALCWIIDEIFYGRQLDKVNLDGDGDGNETGIGMVFVVSGYRSASTHLARSLVEDPSDSLSLVSPNSMMMSVPYLWIWKFVTWFVGDMPETKEEESTTTTTTKGTTQAATKNENPAEMSSVHPTLSKSEVRKWSREKYTKECLERHDFDPFLVDTLDLSFLSCHLNGLVWEYCFATDSPGVVWKEFHYAKHTPENKDLYEVDFCRHMDRLARKTVLFHKSYENENDDHDDDDDDHDDDASHSKTAVLFKGHFLSIVPTLQQNYPTAKFLTVLRDPCDRLKSAINYTAVNPSISGSMDRQNPDHWKLLAKTLERTEAEYCLEEVKTFGRNKNQNNRFLSVHFDAIASPSKEADTIASIQRWILPGTRGKQKKETARNQTRKATATTSKRTKKTKRYMVDKTLHEVGIDEIAYRNRLDEYLVYMKDVGAKKKIV